MSNRAPKENRSTAALGELSRKLNSEIEQALDAGHGVPPKLLRRLEQVAQYSAIHAKRRTPNAARAFVLAVSVVLTLVLVLSSVRRTQVADVDVFVSDATFRVDGNSTSTEAMLGPSTRIETENAELPPQCDSTQLHDPANASHLLIRGEGSFAPLFVGDGDPVEQPIGVRYRAEDQHTVWVSFQPPMNGHSALTLDIPLGLTSASVSLGSDDKSLCQLNNDRLMLRGRQFRFAPIERVGPLEVTSVDLFDHRSVGDKAYASSSVRVGAVRFESIPGLRLEVQQGASLSVSSDGSPLVLYLAPDTAGLHVFLHGRFSQIVDSGKDLRPSFLDEFVGSPYIKGVASAFSAAITILLAVMRRFGVEA